MTRLGKAHVESLLADFDADPVGALTRALRITLDAPSLGWEALLALAAISVERRDRLQRGDPFALDELASELNEMREIARVSQ